VCPTWRDITQAVGFIISVSHFESVLEGKLGFAQCQSDFIAVSAVEYKFRIPRAETGFQTLGFGTH
jgi:hypothetical protein